MKKNQELESLNQQIEGLFQQWKGLQPMKPEDQARFDRKVRLDWNYHSNKIEGNTLSYQETKSLLDEGKEEGIHPARDYKEIKAHDLAINKIKELAKDEERNLTEAGIRDLNQIILKEPFWKEAVTTDGQRTKKKIIPGQYKEQPNHVITEEGKTFRFAEPNDVAPKMKDLMDWFHKEIKNPTLPIALFLAELHHRFIVIHPFDDGNGRVTRLWLNYVLLKLGYPPLAVKVEDKRNYFAALQRADNKDIDALAIYLGKVLVEWLEIGIKASKGEDISDPSDVDKEVDLFVREQKSKGLPQYFSRKLAINVIDNLSDTLFETFKNKFQVFDTLFNSTEIKQSIVKPNKKFIIDEKPRYKWDLMSFIEKENFVAKYIERDPFDDPAWEEDPTTVSENFVNREDIKKHLELLGDSPIWFESVFTDPLSDSDIIYIGIHIEISYSLYRGQHSKRLKNPFNISTSLLIAIGKLKYDISISHRLFNGIESDKKSEVSEERYYNQLLTQEEADEFIAKGKSEFFKLIENAIGEDKGDEKQNTKPESTLNQEKNKK